MSLDEGGLNALWVIRKGLSYYPMDRYLSVSDIDLLALKNLKISNDQMMSRRE